MEDCKGETWSCHVKIIPSCDLSRCQCHEGERWHRCDVKVSYEPSRMNHETASISRATSVSRASRRSSVSRAQSLIRKNTSPQDLRPSDILIERFVAWKAIVKQLIAYFEVRRRSACTS